MNREKNLASLEETEWDVAIIGGGATGLGAAVDSASRGFKTVLLEQSDFAKGTSSRSTKLIHGGLRYLQQGHISLVIEALQERSFLYENAPHLIHHLPFIVPTYRWWEKPFYGIGLKIYDLLSGKWGLEPSRSLSRQETLHHIPTLEKKGLRGGVLYYDGQFDDTRLAINLAKTAQDHGASLLNYMKVTALIKKKGRITGVKAKEMLGGKTATIHARVVINATGIFSDKVRHLDQQKTKNIITPSQGVHLVLPRKFMPSDTAILVPRTEDCRVIFLVPWHDHVLVGTTDTAVKKPELEPKPLKEEVDFLLSHAARYLSKAPKAKDVISLFAGQRPLITQKKSKSTAKISRDHAIFVSASDLITITGGKWTTYRKMAEDVIDKAIVVGHLAKRPCITKTVKLHGYLKGVDPTKPLSTYGTEVKKINALIKKKSGLKAKLASHLPYREAEVIFAVREEMAQTVEDVLARRLRVLFLDAKAALAAAPRVARLMAAELGKDEKWEKEQVKQFKTVARHYLLEELF